MLATTPLLRRLAPSLLLLALALALAATPLLADGPKSKAPPAAKGKGKEPPAKAPASFDAITTAFDAKEQEAYKDLRRQRITAIETYLKANTAAKDAEAARKSLVDLASEIEEWAKVVTFADAFLGAFGESKQKSDVRLARAGALANLGKEAEAKTAYEELVKGLTLDADGVETCFAAGSAYAEHLLAMGDVEGATKAYEDVREACRHQQVNQIVGMQIKNLDLIGTDPKAFPEGAKDLEGKPVTLADFKDKVVLVDFWATWCGPCRQEMPNVLAAYRKYHDRGFEIVGISLDRPEGEEALKEYIAANQLPWRQVYYPEGENEVARAYGVESIPFTILIGKDGKILRAGLRGSALGRTLERILGKGDAKPTK